MKDKDRADDGGTGRYGSRPTKRSGRKTKGASSGFGPLSKMGLRGRKINPGGNNNNKDQLKTTTTTTTIVLATVTENISNIKPSYKPTKDRFDFFDGRFEEYFGELNSSGKQKTDGGSRVKTKIIARDSKLSKAEQMKNILKIYGSTKQITVVKCSEKWLQHKLKRILSLAKLNNKTKEEIAREYNKLLRKNNCE